MRDPLSPETRALLDLARDGDDPEPGERERMRAAVMAAIAGGAAAGATAVSGTAAASANTAAASAAAPAAATTTAATATATAATAATATGAATAGTATAGTVAGLSSLGAVITKTALALAVAGAVTTGTVVGVTEMEAGSEDAAHAVSVPAAPGGESREVGGPSPAVAGAGSTPDVIDSIRSDEVSDRDRVEEPRAVEGPRPTARREAPPATASRSDSEPISASAAESVTESVTAAESVTSPPTLSPELTLLRRAQGARRAGDPARALALLDAHARAFPDAVLAPEREAARVLTLCDLGRLAEGRAARAAFLASHPESPLAPRVSAACAP